MKNLFVIFVFNILFSGLAFQVSQAQGPVFFAVFEERVSPSDLAAFDKVQQKTVDLWNKYNLGLTIYCYATDDDMYFWLMPMQNFAGLDAVFEKSQAFMKKASEQEGFDGSGFRDLSTSTFKYIRWMPELSYQSGTSNQSENRNYVEWTYCYMKQGHEKEAGEAIKKYIDFYTKSGEKYEWNMYEIILGNDTPVWVIMTRDTDAIAMRQTEKKLNEKYSREFSEMWADFTKHVRKIENKTGWYKPQWSVNTGQ